MLISIRCSLLSKLIFKGAMHAIAGKAKMMTSLDRPSSVVFSLRWCVDKGSPLGVVVLRRRLAAVETRLGWLVLDRFRVVVVWLWWLSLD
jgi:hypothetical protein